MIRAGRFTFKGIDMIDANSLFHAPAAIDTMLSAGLITQRQADTFRRVLSAKLNDAINYYADKGFNDIADGLNAAWRRMQK